MARPAWKRFAKTTAKGLVAVLVVWAVGRHAAQTWTELGRRGESIHVEAGWVVAAGFLYLAGLSACGVFFAKVLAESPTPVGTLAGVRAYLISHLGKYVPGKAMVVVLRVGLLSPYGARPATAAFATFYETLAMMGAGALVASAGFALGPRPFLWLPILLSLGLGVAFLAVVDPLIFPRVSRLVTLPFPKIGPEAMPRLSRRLLGAGLLWSTAGWVLLGLSQWAVVRAISSETVAPGLLPLLTASVALATVAGFVVAVLPGGLGVREWVLMVTLDRALGSDRAVEAALALRLTWVAAEVVAAAVLALIRPALPPMSSAGPNPGAPPP